MPPWEPPTFDRWTPLNHKRGLAAGRNTAVAPTWVPEEEKRRLAAYAILDAYRTNSQREMLDFTQPMYGEVTEVADLYAREREGEYRRRAHREYGDANLLVTQVTAAILGDEPQIVVPTSEEAPEAEQEANAERQRWLQDWGEDEGLILALIEAEADAQGLGDGVLAMGWDPRAERSVLEVYDPGSYFPVLTGRRAPQYPEAVHFAWEYEEGDKRYVERVTWRLVPVESLTVPWSNTRAERTCIHTDMRWRVDQMGTRHVDDFDDRKGESLLLDEDDREIAERDLEVDFLPVIHRPGGPPSRKEHYGQSLLSNVAQLLDDIAFGDTDLRAAATLAAGPVVGLAGAKADSELVVQPGTVFQMGENGRMDVLDLTQGLERLGKLEADLLARLSVNARVPEEILGRVRASDVPSGVTLLLAFAPFRSLVGQTRLARKRKDQLVLKFNQRFAQVAGELESGPTVRADLVPGQFLPSDLDAAVKRAGDLIKGRTGSRRTAVQHLADAGLDVGAVEEEVERIEHEDFVGANQLAEALASETAAADYLGREPADNPDPPEIPIETP